MESILQVKDVNCWGYQGLLFYEPEQQFPGNSRRSVHVADRLESFVLLIAFFEPCTDEMFGMTSWLHMSMLEFCIS